MNPIVRNILAILGGIIIGSLVNMGIVFLSPYLIPLPAGVNPTDPESIKAAIDLFETKHYIMPFLAHAIGTFVGAWFTASIVTENKVRVALYIGLFFLFSGVANAFMIGISVNAAIIDWIGAYIPMAFLGGKLATKNNRSKEKI